ncbi:MAG: carbon-nitrogen hydrolase family protein [Verrucomicrobiota bacterium]
MNAGRQCHLRLALGQIRVEGGDVAGNLGRAAGAVEHARAGGAEMILLPEALDCGWTDPSAAQLAEPIPEGGVCRKLAAFAHGAGIWVCAGLTEREGAAVYNSGVLLDPQGRVVLKHRKIHELSLAHATYAMGDRLQVAETPWGRVGLMICADAFAPGQAIGRALGLMGSRLILSPCAWAVPEDHDPIQEPYGALWRENYGPVARDFRLWIAGCSQVGTIRGGDWAGRSCIGNSLVVGPDGSTRWQGPYGFDAEMVMILDLEFPRRSPRGDLAGAEPTPETGGNRAAQLDCGWPLEEWFRPNAPSGAGST